MSVYTPLDASQMTRLLAAFGYTLVDYRGASHGIENSTFLIEARDDREKPVALVLTVFESLSSEALQPYLHLLAQLANDPLLPVPGPLSDAQGRWQITVAGKPAVLVGIESGGAWIAEALNQKLGAALPLGTLNPAFYRDDFDTRGLKATVTPSKLPFEIDGQHIVLVDDVLMTGRTIRAAMNELFDFGRPASITLVVLFDIGHRELPIRADICGETLALPPHQRVELRGPAPLVAEIRDTRPEE